MSIAFRTGSAALLTLACLGCRPPGPALAPAPVPAQADASDELETSSQENDAEIEPEAEAQGFRFWIVNDGLRAYDLEGNQVAALAEIGERAIRLSDGRLVVFTSSDGDAKVLLLDADGQGQGHWQVPNGLDYDTCKPALSGEFEMQSSHDFAISEDQRSVCLNFLDRNENMATYEVSASVNLDSGAVASALTLDFDEDCPVGDLPTTCDASVEPWVEGTSAPSPDHGPRMAYDEGSGWLMGADNEQVADLCPDWARNGSQSDDDELWGCAMIEAGQPQGRWMLLTGNTSEGDYIHRELVFLDRKAGELWVVGSAEHGEGYTWTKITAPQLFDDRWYSAIDVVGESEIQALPGDRFWIDGMLMIPERREVVWIGGVQALTAK